MKESDIIKLIEKEYKEAIKKYSSFNSAHEGYAVIKEELDELWEEIKNKYNKRNYQKMMKESIQISAMAIRFIMIYA